MTEEEIESIAEKYAIRNYGTEDVVQSNLLQAISKDSFQDGAKWGMEHAIEWYKAEKRPKGYKQDFDVALKVLNYNTGQIESDYGYYSVEYKKFYYSKFRFDIIAWYELPQFKE